MTNEQWVAVEKAYNDLIKCFTYSGNTKAVNTVIVHKSLAELERENQIEKEEHYFETGSIEIH